MHVAAIEPYAFEGPYSHCYDLPLSCMDRRHVYLMHEILCSWPFKSALEIGCFNGASTTAFIEALNSGKGLGESGVALFCDVSVQDSLIDVVVSCRDGKRVNITPQPSWAVLDSEVPFDFVFVDGSHDIDTVTLEVKRLLRRRPLCIMAHDTNSTDAGFHRCEGAAFLRRTLEQHGGYWFLEDAETRPGERTDRGLFFATTNDQLYHIARGIYARYR